MDLGVGNRLPLLTTDLGCGGHCLLQRLFYKNNKKFRNSSEKVNSVQPKKGPKSLEKVPEKLTPKFAQFSLAFVTNNHASVTRL